MLLIWSKILQFVHQLMAANANIGASRAALFPRLALTTSLDIASDAFSGLFRFGSMTWLFTPQVFLPTFDAGSNRANLLGAKVDRDLVLAQFEKAIQTAFRKTADAKVQLVANDDQSAAQQSLTDVNAESCRLSQARYQKGVDSYLNVLDSQRALYSARQNLIGTRLTRLTNLVALYQILGGGGG